MNKIVSTKRTSAIFLAIVLVTGTIAAISPSFITVEKAHAEILDFVMDMFESKDSSYSGEYQSNNNNDYYKSKYPTT